MSAFAYTIEPTLGATSDPAVASSRTIEALRMRALKDWRYDFDAQDIVTPRELVEGVDAVIQRAMIRVRFVLGEWFLDTRLGVPYLQRVLVASPHIPSIVQLFTAVFLSVPEIVAVQNMFPILNRSTRRLTLSGFTLVLSDGLKIRNTVPFIV